MLAIAVQLRTLMRVIYADIGGDGVEYCHWIGALCMPMIGDARAPPVAPF